MKRQQTFNIKGMTRDISPSKSNGEYAYEIKNMRITAQEGETMLSLVNEKGNQEYTLTDITGVTDSDGNAVDKSMRDNDRITGYCVLDKYLVLFTHNADDSSAPDCIYRLRTAFGSNMSCYRLYEGNLGFTDDMVLETLGVYESEVIQKVYWIDGVHQPRFINIVADTDTQNLWKRQETPFDFISKYNDSATVTIEKTDYSGAFPSGTVQYAMSYYNLNGQQTNIFYASPIYYASHSNRGGAADETVSNSFTITISNPDTNFDYLRIYRILRTTANDTPSCRLLQDISISGDSSSVTVVDTGIYGTAVDPYEILYAGGRDIIPETMAQKDNTLFFGNFKVERSLFFQGTDSMRNRLQQLASNSSLEYYWGNSIQKGTTGSIYMYESQLKDNSHRITTFKGGENYRFGLVFQDEKGEWSNVVYLCDKHNSLYPMDKVNSFQPVKARFTIPSDVVTAIYNEGYRKVRGVVVYPAYADREVIMQGVLCPTVYSIADRKQNTPYAQSSWFFRDMHGDDSSISPNHNAYEVQNRHNCNISSMHVGDTVSSLSLYDSEIYGASSKDISASDTGSESNKMDMFVDWNILTMNTPELDFSDTIFPTSGLKMRIVGAIPLTSCSSDMSVNTSTTPKNSKVTNFDKQTFSYSNLSVNGNRLKLSRFEWQDEVTYTGVQGSNNDVKEESIWKFPVFPWQRDRISVQDEATETGLWYNQIRTKTIANIRTSALTLFFNSSDSYDISSVGIYNGTNTLSRLDADSNDLDYSSGFNYYGEVDNILIPDEEYQLMAIAHISDFESSNWGTEDDIPSPYIGYRGTSDDYKALNLSSMSTGWDTYDSDSLFLYTPKKVTDSVRMKYKSSPHAAFQLRYTSDHKQTILPYLQTSWGNIGQMSSSGTPHWSIRYQQNTASTDYGISQRSISLTDTNVFNTTVSQFRNYGFMYIGEIYRDNISKEALFGGTSESALQGNTWNVAGSAVTLVPGSNLAVPFDQGDTYYQRYDCLKTYPYTEEDANQIVEILSFMCETRVNIDGRYDTQRGQSSNLNMRPANFNLLNPAYTQNDNFFTNSYLDYRKNNTIRYPNTVLWTKTKTLGEDVDSWTNIQQTSLLDLDGDKGSIHALKNYNDDLLAFQDNGIAKILYNERVQINASDGVPIEIANSGKVQGKQYLSDRIGCTNKRTIQITPNGLYFMDGNSKDIYSISNGLSSLSKAKGFNNWLYSKDFSRYRTFYDEKAADLYFVDDSSCLVYSEQLGEFEGFYSYEGTDFMFNLEDSFVAVRDNKLWHQFAGDYNYFFKPNGTSDDTEDIWYKPFYVTYISNEGLHDKIFGNLDFLADSWNADNELQGTTFDTLSAWNEYQFGVSKLSTVNANRKYYWSNLKRKFRIWRADMPRAVYFSPLVSIDGIEKFVDEIEIKNPVVIDVSPDYTFTKSMDRIRSTWAYVRLSMQEKNTNKTVLHNATVGYYD